MTERQRDIMALYCLHMGITSPQNIKNHIQQYLEIRDIVGLCCEEIAQKEQRDAIQEKDGN